LNLQNNWKKLKQSSERFRYWPKISGWFSNIKSKIITFDIKPAKPIVPQLLVDFDAAMATDDRNAAENCLLSILRVNANNQAALFLLANLYINANAKHEAHKILRHALKLYPNDYRMHKLLGRMHAAQGKYKASVAAYRQSLKLNPDSPEVQYFLDAVEGRAPTIAPREYIIGLYDDYAVRFEKSLLQHLKYHAHIDLVNILQTHAQLAQPISTVLDLGCGTGLLGQELCAKLQITTLIGIDLSANMLAAAQAKNIYTSLENSDLIEYLQNHSEVFELILAADVLIYFGELEHIFSAVFQRLQPRGYFAFTVEALQQGSVKLQANGRFQHSWSYIDTVVVRNGFRKIYSQGIDLRKEYGNIVPGYLVLLQK